MFEIGFGELLVIALVGLYVIKPKHFPVIAKLIGRRLQSFKKSLYNIKAEFNAQVQDMQSDKTHE